MMLVQKAQVMSRACCAWYYIYMHKR